MRISDWSSDVCSSDLIASASELFGIDDAQALIDHLKAHYPQLAANLSPQGYALPRVAALCRALLEERVPLRDFRKIAEAMVALAGQGAHGGDVVQAQQREIGRAHV